MLDHSPCKEKSFDLNESRLECSSARPQDSMLWKRHLFRRLPTEPSWANVIPHQKVFDFFELYYCQWLILGWWWARPWPTSPSLHTGLSPRFNKVRQNHHHREWARKLFRVWYFIASNIGTNVQIIANAKWNEENGNRTELNRTELNEWSDDITKQKQQQHRHRHQQHRADNTQQRYWRHIQSRALCSWCIVIILCNVYAVWYMSVCCVYIRSMETISVLALPLRFLSLGVQYTKQHHICLHIRKFLVYINCNKNKLNFFLAVLYEIIISIKSIRSGERKGKEEENIDEQTKIPAHCFAWICCWPHFNLIIRDIFTIPNTHSLALLMFICVCFVLYICTVCVCVHDVYICMHCIRCCAYFFLSSRNFFRSFKRK